MPAWVKDAVDAWTAAAGITEGTAFRAISKRGRVWGNGMTPKVLWDVVRHAAAEADMPSWPRTICDAPVPGCVTSPGANWTRSSSSSAYLDSNNRALPRVQTEAPARGERPDGH
jgi:hypothetical protein